MKASAIATAIGALLVALVGARAAPQAGTAPEVPDNLRVPSTQALTHETRATGVQIYDCKASKDDPARFEWTFRSPEAELFDTAGKRVGKHYAGPTWEWNDGSKVVGEARAKYDSPDAGAIPWLLLSAKSTSGAGALEGTLSVQRVSTVGGTAPSGGCSQAQSGKEARVPYTATYNFYAAKS